MIQNTTLNCFNKVFTEWLFFQVIKETLRKYPPAPGTARDTVCDTVIDGVAIPKGSCVQVSYRYSQIKSKIL